jgi:hypothetical protein
MKHINITPSRILRPVLFVLLCITTHLVSLAGTESDTLTVIDQSTHAPIAFAAIYVHGNRLASAIANSLGQFHLRNVSEGDTLTITSMGYKNRNLTYERARSSRSIALQPSVYQISDVVITNKSYLPYIKQIWNNISKNAPNPYPILEGLYRQQVAVNGRLAIAAECDVKMKEPKFNKSGSNVAKISTKNRRAFVSRKYEYAKHFNFAMIPAGYPAIYEINPTSYNEYYYETDEPFKNDEGQLITKLSFTRKDGRGSGYVYIDEKDKAVLKFHFTRTAKRNKYSEDRDSVDYIVSTWDTQYKQLDGKYIHSYSRLETEYLVTSMNQQLPSNKVNVVVDYTTNNVLLNSRLNDSYFSSDISPFKEMVDVDICNLSDLKGGITDFK